MTPDTAPSAARLTSFTVGDWLIEPRACVLSRPGTSEKLRPQLVDLANPNIGEEKKLLPLAEIGLARSLVGAGDAAAGRRTYEQFFERWKDADADLPVLLEARRAYAALTGRR